MDDCIHDIIDSDTRAMLISILNMRKFLVVSFLLFPISPSAVGAKSITYPFLAWFYKGKVHIRVYGVLKQDPPRKLIAFDVRGNWERPPLKAPVALNLTYEKRETVFENVRRGIKERRTYLIYDVVNKSDIIKDGPLIIFSRDQNILTIEKTDIRKYYEAATNLSWAVIYAVSMEGSHHIIQEYAGPECLRSIDYYNYARHGAGGEKGVSETERALCGNLVYPESVQP